MPTPCARPSRAPAALPPDATNHAVTPCPTPILNTQPNIAAPDDFYEALIALHRDLSDAQSALVNAKLILLLANHIGDPAVLREAMRAAREDVAPAASNPWTRLP